jgi:hypothetical protein
MAVPTNLHQYVTVKWVIPSGVVSPTYDSINIYRSSQEAGNYTLLATIDILDGDDNPQTSYVDSTQSLASKDSVHYMVIFSGNSGATVSDSYLAYKALTPREQRLILQIRDSLSRFISNSLADEELRQYLEQGLQGVNVYSPTTSFTAFDLPQSLEPLVILGAVIFGSAHNMLKIGFTDIQYSDQGWSLTANRMDKMGQQFDRIIKLYNELLAIAKLDYAEGPVAAGTCMLPISLGGNLGRSVLEIFNLIGSAGR